MKQSLPNAAVARALEHARGLIDSGHWVRIELAPQRLKLTRPTFASVEWGTYGPDGEPEKSIVTRYYYDDGSYYSSIRG